MNNDDLINRVARDMAREHGRTEKNPWGKSGWIWERVHPDQIVGYTPEVLAKNREWMQAPAKCGGNSRAGGPAMKMEIWRNAHWFVHLNRDETVLCASHDNAGPKGDADDGFHFPEMIWLSMRRTDRNDATNRDWREMQRVKNELVGKQHEAVELYPAESRLVDTADQFHLWVFAQPCDVAAFPFGYMARETDPDDDFTGTQRPIE